MYYLGIDLGGTNIAVGVVSEDGTIINSCTTPTLSNRNFQEIIKDMANLSLKLLEDSNISLEYVASIGIGSPGVCNSDTGVIEYSNNLKLLNVPIKYELQRYINLPIYLENDANCAAYAESLVGAAKDYKSSITVTLGTGVGGGIIIDNKIVTGAFNRGGEIGHHIINVNGIECSCGNKGCWEAYASATALIRETKNVIKNFPNSKINELSQNNLDNITAKIVFDAADYGDDIAINILDNYYRYIGIGIANIINILEPMAVIIGGGISAQKDKLIIPVKKYIKEYIYDGNLKSEIKVAKLGNDAGIIGAALLGKKIKF